MKNIYVTSNFRRGQSCHLNICILGFRRINFFLHKHSKIFLPNASGFWSKKKVFQSFLAGGIFAYANFRIEMRPSYGFCLFLEPEDRLANGGVGENADQVRRDLCRHLRSLQETALSDRWLGTVAFYYILYISYYILSF